MNDKQQKVLDYTTVLLKKFQEASEEGEIDLEELGEGDTLNLLFHALANVMPCLAINELTGNEYDLLEFNHIANKLIFQYERKKTN